MRAQPIQPSNPSTWVPPPTTVTAPKAPFGGQPRPVKPKADRRTITLRQNLREARVGLTKNEGIVRPKGTLPEWSKDKQAKKEAMRLYQSAAKGRKAIMPIPAMPKITDRTKPTL